MSTVPQVRILIVDDDLELATAMGAVLEMSCAFSIAVRFAHDGMAAVAGVCEHCPHIAILDIDMPGLSGFGAAAAIKALTLTRAPLLICATGNASHSKHIDARLIDHFPQTSGHRPIGQHRFKPPARTRLGRSRYP